MKFFRGVTVGAALTSVVLVATVAFAGSGVGALFNLGANNTVNASTVLTGSTNGRQLRVVNNGSGAGATGVGIHTAANRPPLAVNSPTKVTNLNADKLDGLDGKQLQRRLAVGTCPWGPIASIGADGSFACSKSTIDSHWHIVGYGHGLTDALNASPIDAEWACHTHTSAAQVIITNNGMGTGTLNWMYSLGGATSTVYASGVILGPGDHATFDAGATRLEGQFIWADPHHVFTLRVDVFDDGGGCTFVATTTGRNS